MPSLNKKSLNHQDTKTPRTRLFVNHKYTRKNANIPVSWCLFVVFSLKNLVPWCLGGLKNYNAHTYLFFTPFFSSFPESAQQILGESMDSPRIGFANSGYDILKRRTAA